WGWLLRARRNAERRRLLSGTTRTTYTTQAGSTGFHLAMTLVTGGLWAIVWAFSRRRDTMRRRRGCVAALRLGGRPPMLRRVAPHRVVGHPWASATGQSKTADIRANARAISQPGPVGATSLG